MRLRGSGRISEWRKFQVLKASPQLPYSQVKGTKTIVGICLPKAAYKIVNITTQGT